VTLANDQAHLLRKVGLMKTDQAAPERASKHDMDGSRSFGVLTVWSCMTIGSARQATWSCITLRADTLLRRRQAHLLHGYEAPRERRADSLRSIVPQVLFPYLQPSKARRTRRKAPRASSTASLQRPSCRWQRRRMKGTGAGRRGGSRIVTPKCRPRSDDSTYKRNADRRAVFARQAESED
jgi:hypothetical protein